MKHYQGHRTATGADVTVREEAGEERPLNPRFDLRNHSPTGFEWGYAGSGPAQLALALAADVLGNDERAQDIYQDLKSKLVGRLKGDWIISEGEVRACIAEIELGQRRR